MSNFKSFYSLLSLLAVLLISGCIGTSNVAVVYLQPDSTTNYSGANFKPAVEFPDGLPIQAEVQIRINGTDVTDDFDDWGNTGTGSANINVAEVTQVVGPLATPLIWGALRDGVNTFQVSIPNKSTIYFTMDMPSAAIHIITVMDGYDGLNPKDGSPLHVEGFLEGKDYANILNLNIQVSQINQNGDLVAIAATGSNINVTPGNTVTDGAFYATLNSDYTFEFEVYDGDLDGDAVTITVTDSEGSISKTWARPNVPLYDSRLTNNGVLSSRIKEKTIMSFTKFLSDGFVANSLGLKDGPPLDILGMGYLWVLEDEIRGSANIDFSMPIPTADGGPAGVPRGSLQITADFKQVWFRASGDGVFAICKYTDVLADLYAETDVTLVIDPITYKASANVSIRQLDLTNLDVNMWDPNALINLLCGVVGGIIGPLAGALADPLSDMIGDVVDAVVNAVFNKDLPLLRLVFQGQYMTLSPQMVRVSSSVDPWKIGNNPTEDDVGLDTSLGFHTRGVGGRPNKSIGSLYNNTYLADAVTTTDQVNGQNKRFVGTYLGENFVNQLMMGLWESGILYIDFNAGFIPQNPLLDDAIIKFYSASPWEIDFKDQSNPEGNLLITIPDLIVSFQADAYNPLTGALLYDDYNFYNFNVNISFYGTIASDLTTNALTLTLASNPEIEVISNSSDIYPVSNAQGQQMVDSAMKALTLALGSMEIPLPIVAGMIIDMGEVWTDETSLAITVDAFNPSAFPPGTFGSVFDIENASYNVNETDGSVTITVTRQSLRYEADSINISTSSGTALAGSDFASLSTSVSFAEGETSKTVDVEILDDTVIECAIKDFNLALSNPAGYSSLGSQSTSKVNITDNDVFGKGNGTGPAGAYNESFEGGWGNWTNTGNRNYTRRSGGTPSSNTGPGGASNGSQYIYSETTDYEGNVFTINTSYFHNLTNVTFDYHMWDSGSNNMGTATLAWKDGCGTWTTIWSRTNGQGNTWHMNESVDFTGLGATEIRFSHGPVQGYRGDFALDNIRLGSSIEGSVFEMASATYNVNEDVGTVDITVNRTYNLGLAANVDIGTSNGSATSGADYNAVNTTLNFLAGETSKTITIDILDDLVTECGGESFNILLSNASALSSIGSQGDSVVNIGDDDMGGTGTGPYGGYLESFESGLGYWTNTGTRNYTRQSGGTPSGNTGPGGASNGSQYIFSEVTNEENRVFTINTSYFEDLTSVNFDYHMWDSGSNDMGTATLAWKNACGAWTTIWSRTNGQGNQWNTNTQVDFTGLNATEIRFSHGPVQGYRGDFALDNIIINAAIWVPPPVLVLIDSASGTITNQYNNSPAGEQDWMVFDGNSGTKFLTQNNSGWLQVQLPAAVALKSYTVTSANDADARDPRDWVMQGSNDGSSWTNVDSRSGIDFPSRFQKLTFDTSGNSTAYSYYRFNVTANSGDSLLQYSEIELFSY